MAEALTLKSETKADGRARLWLGNVSQDNQPIDGIIRATIDQMPADITQGDHITLPLTLYPLSGPLFAYWPDYARKSWSEGISGTAYGRAPKRIPPSKDGDGLSDKPKLSIITQMRKHIRHATRQDLSQTNATLAEALLIGERDFSDESFYMPFRAAGLAHLLAISGLHMGLFCFGVYGLLRMILALPVSLSAKIGHHKIAAIAALGSGFFYLCLAGAPISAIRAFIMTSLILCALLIGRRMVTIRNLHIVFCGFLLCHPSELYIPAFQLSFAATYGIVLFHDGQQGRVNHYGKWARRLFYLFATSAIAILSTVLITAFHFGTFTPWGVISNIFAIPFTALVVMPVGIFYLLTLSIGLGSASGWLLDIVLSVFVSFARYMADLPFASLPLLTPPPAYLPLSALGVMAYYLMPAKGRLALVTMALTACLLWQGQVAPRGAITGDDGFRRFATVDNGTLYHSHRLTSFWQSSYKRLLGDFTDNQQIRCCTSCQLSLSSGHRFEVFLSQADLTCPQDNQTIIITKAGLCHHHPYHHIKRGQVAARIIFCADFGYALKEDTRPKARRPWHPHYRLAHERYQR